MSIDWRQGWAAIWIIALCVMVFPTSIVAQDDDEPLRLGLVDVDDGQDHVVETLAGLFDDSSRIDLTDGRFVVDTAIGEGVDDDFAGDFRQGQYEDEIAAAMFHYGVEALVIYDSAQQRGDEVSIMAVGPRGNEVVRVKGSTIDGRLGDDEAMSMLEDLFSDLVPEIRNFRSDIERGVVTEDDFQLPDEAGGGEGPTDLREAAAEAHRLKYGNLQPHLELRAGGLIGHRSLAMDQPDGDFNLEHETMLFGLAVGVDSLITTIDRDTAAFEFGGFFSMAPFSSVFDDEELPGRFIRFGADARYISALSATTRLRAIGGLETANLSLLEPSDQYTGSGYLTARVGAGVHYSFGSLMTLQVDALFMPVLTGSNSGGAYGEPEGWLGIGADTTLRIDALNPVRLNLDYNIQYLELDYPEPVDIEGAAGSSDIFHQVMVTVGYRL